MFRVSHNFVTFSGRTMEVWGFTAGMGKLMATENGWEIH